jgi:hypothetical protein
LLHRGARTNETISFPGGGQTGRHGTRKRRWESRTEVFVLDVAPRFALELDFVLRLLGEMLDEQLLCTVAGQTGTAERKRGKC